MNKTEIQVDSSNGHKNIKIVIHASGDSAEETIESAIEEIKESLDGNNNWISLRKEHTRDTYKPSSNNYGHILLIILLFVFGAILAYREFLKYKWEKALLDSGATLKEIEESEKSIKDNTISSNLMRMEQSKYFKLSMISILLGMGLMFHDVLKNLFSTPIMYFGFMMVLLGVAMYFYSRRI